MGLEEKLRLYLDTICEVKTLENELLVVARVKQVVNKLSLSMDIVESEGEPMPLTFYGAPVKISLHSSTHGMLVVGGKVYLCNRAFWRISNLVEFQNMERRGFFRVPTDATGLVQQLVNVDAQGRVNAPVPGAEEEPVYPVQLINISLSGVLFVSETRFRPMQYLNLHSFQLSNDTTPFSVACRVRRCDEETSAGYLCRCSFEDLHQRDSDRLCRDIFALQREIIQKKKNRV